MFLRLPVTLSSLCLASTMLIAVSADAQDQEAEQAPAHIAVVDGAATLDRDGEVDTAGPGMPFVPGDRLRTALGRMEILFPDGSALDLDQFTAVDLLSPTLLRITEGRTRLTVAGTENPSAALRYQIDTPAAAVVTDGPGEFRIAVRSGSADGESELAVVRGFAALTNERGSINVRAGERTLARNAESPSYPQIFNSARFDAFDRWAEARRFDRTRSTASTQYLPDDLQMYGSTFDRYGAWRYEPTYGNVWYPSVAFDWRPYYNGYWSALRPFGWTWIGLDVWSWPTHHYGRWGHARNQWFWIPERRWGSAWVSWGAAPGYVSWCPLGFDNRPVFGMKVVAEPWAGWVVVPRTHFTARRVGQWAIAPYRLHNTAFAVQASAPVQPTYAVPRRGGIGNVVPADRATSAIPRTATAASQQTAGSLPRVPVRPSLAGSPQAAGRPVADGLPARLDRDGSVRQRQPGSDGPFQPSRAESPQVDRARAYGANRTQGDGSTQPSAETPRASQRNPYALQTKTPGPDASAQPPRATVPRWTLPGGPAYNPNATPPQATPGTPPAAMPRWGLPGGSLNGQGDRNGESAPAAAPRRHTAGAYAPPGRPAESAAPDPTPRWGGSGSTRSAPPPARPAQESAPAHAPGMAVPRSGPAPSAGEAPSGVQRGSSSGVGAGTGGGGSGGGARQRHP